MRYALTRSAQCSKRYVEMSKVTKIIKLESIKAYGDEIFPNEIWSLYVEDNKYIVIEYVKDDNCKSK